MEEYVNFIASYAVVMTILAIVLPIFAFDSGKHEGWMEGHKKASDTFNKVLETFGHRERDKR